MIEQLTPRVFSSLLLVVLGLTPLLTLLFSAILLWLYRRAVTRQMALAGGCSEELDAALDPGVEPGGADAPHQRPAGVELYRQAVRRPWQALLRCAAAGLAFALVFAVAARFVYPFRLGAPGFLIAVWIYLWPVVLALLLIVPASLGKRLSYVAAYWAVLLVLIFWAGTIHDIPAMQVGSLSLPARSSANPWTTTKLWLVVNGVPTLLMMLCFNRWVRAVAPLMLGLVATALGGMLVAYMALYSKRGIDLAVAVAVSLDIHVGWVVLATLLTSLAAFGALGWLVARWVARAYRRKAVNDRSLMLDALWLLFATYYAMWLILGGLVWTATAPVAFAVYKLALALARRGGGAPQAGPGGLTFLRVFSLGRRSEQLLDVLSRSWRHIGSVQMITGPDVARSTVQPHQFLDFVSGKLASHFVRDAPSLERRLAESDRSADPDGSFRINNFFCHADWWQRALPRLVQAKDVVLMDLRSFSSGNAGCIHELEFLVGHVPLDRCLLVVDPTTDQPFLERTLDQAWRDLPSDSPNRGRSPNEAPVHPFEAGSEALRHLLRRLCDAAG